MQGRLCLGSNHHWGGILREVKPFLIKGLRGALEQ